MISFETLSKIDKDDEFTALKAMHTLEKFCLDRRECTKCPFFCPGLVAYGYESACYLTRTDSFTPADWSIEPLSNVEKEIVKMTMDEILDTFCDINFAYNNASKYDTLKRMLEELQERTRQSVLDKVLDEIEQDAFHDANGVIYCSFNRVRQIIKKYEEGV